MNDPTKSAAPGGYRAQDFLRDLLAIGGVAMIFAGCWMIYPPAAFIVTGLLLFGLSVWRG